MISNNIDPTQSYTTFIRVTVYNRQTPTINSNNRDYTRAYSSSGWRMIARLFQKIAECERIVVSYQTRIWCHFELYMWRLQRSDWWECNSYGPHLLHGLKHMDAWWRIYPYSHRRRCSDNLHNYNRQLGHVYEQHPWHLGTGRPIRFIRFASLPQAKFGI